MRASTLSIHRIYIDCSVCSSKKYEEVYRSKFRLWRHGKVYTWAARQVICKDCGMLYTNPQPSDEVLRWFYETDLRLGDTSPYYRKQQVEFLRRHIPGKKLSLFDVGAYDGDLLHLAAQQGYAVFGIEPAAEAVALAKKKYSIKLLHDFLDEAFVARHPQQYDIVTIRHTLEHVQDPVAFIRLALRLTKPEGHVYIEVPDASRPFAKNVADFFSNQHLLHFTPTTLASLARVVGVEIAAVEQIPELPIQRMLLRNAPAIGKLTNEYKRNKKTVERYKDSRNAFLKHLKDHIAAQVTPDMRSLVIYGAGMHTTQLLQSGILKSVTIEAVVDSNPKKWDMSFEGLTVSAPTVLADTTIPVLISSYDNQEDIARYLTEHYPAHPQIKLYDRVISYNRGGSTQ